MNAIKNKLCAIALCLSVSIMNYSAIGMTLEDGDDYILYSMADTPPSFMGAEDMSLLRFREWIESNLTMNNLQESAPIIFSAIVELDGRLSNINVLRDRTGNSALQSDLDQTIQKAPRWAPGIKDNMPQRVYIMLDVNFMRPDLLAQKRKDDAERNQKELNTSLDQDRYRKLKSYGINPDTETIDSLEQLNNLISTASKPIAVVIIGSPFYVPVKSMMEEWDMVLGQYKSGYTRYVTYDRSSGTNKTDELERYYGIDTCPSILFIYDKAGNYEIYTKGYLKNEEYRNNLRDWFGKMMNKAKFQ